MIEVVGLSFFRLLSHFHSFSSDIASSFALFRCSACVKSDTEFVHMSQRRYIQSSSILRFLGDHVFVDFLLWVLRFPVFSHVNCIISCPVRHLVYGFCVSQIV